MFCQEAKITLITSKLVYYFFNLVALRLHASYSTLQRDMACRQIQNEHLSGYWRFLKGRLEAGLSQQDKNDLRRMQLFIVRGETMIKKNIEGWKILLLYTKDWTTKLLHSIGDAVIFSILTSWAGSRLLSSWRGTHGSFQAHHAVGCSRGRTVSARFTGHLTHWANRTSIASRAGVAVGTIRWSRTRASTQAHISVGINKENKLHIK